MSANELQQPLINAMKLLSENAVSQDNSVKSIKAVVEKVKDEGLNTYIVSYGGNQFEAAATNAGIKYQTGDIVYVLIPNGDFTQKKLIIGAVAARAAMYSSSTIKSNAYMNVSNNIIGQVGDINLATWKDCLSTEPYPYDIININEINPNFNSVFSEYLQKYRTVLFSAKIRTDIDKDHQTKGNYGLKLELPFKRNDESIVKIFSMDVTTMQGNPYAYTREQAINIYFDIEDNLVYDLEGSPRLVPFTEGFGYLSPREVEGDADVFIRDVGFQVSERIPESALNSYSLSIIANKGLMFLAEDDDNTATRVLEPVLRLDGKETTIDSWECYWFVEDSTIKIDSDGYTTQGGMGWKCVNDKTGISYDGTGKAVFRYVLNKYTYTVKIADVISSRRYKCVLIQDDVVVSNIVELKNLKKDIKIELLPANGSTVFPENTGNVNLIARIYYPGITDNPSSIVSFDTDWQRFDKDGKYLEPTAIDGFYTRVRVNDPVMIGGKRHLETEISYPCSSLDKVNLINCTFYEIRGDGVKSHLGTSQLTVTTSEQIGYRVLVENGDVIYKYDADGDSPKVADYDGPVSSQIKSTAPISYRMFKDDGNELSSEDYNFCKYIWKLPKNSMMEFDLPEDHDEENDEEDYYILTGYGKVDLRYDIASSYDKSKSNNTIILTLDYAGNVVKQSLHIKFLKDGESGTNGTKYTAIIRYGDYSYGERDENGKIRKLQCIYVNGSGWKRYNIDNAGNESLVSFDSPVLEVDIYKDGQKVTNNNEYSVLWKMFDSAGSYLNFNIMNSSENKNGILINIENWADASKIYTNIVEAEVTISEGDDTYSREVLYAYYPIEITRLINSSFENSIIPTLDGGFSEVVYATDGTNPSYDSSTPFVCTNNLLADANDYYTYSWDSNDNVEIEEEENKKCIARPVSKFESGDSQNYVKAIISMSADQQTQLENLKTAAAAEVENKQKEYNYYSVERVRVDNLNNFNYNTYLNSLKNSQLLLSYIYQAVGIFNDLKAVGDDIRAYYSREEVSSQVSINLEQIINSNLEEVVNEQERVHNLIEGGSLELLTGLQDKVIAFNREMVSDVSIYQQLQQLIDRWNNYISVKYNAVFTALTRKTGTVYDFQSQVDNLGNNIYGQLSSFITDVLVPLVTPVDGREPDSKFISLKNSIQTIFNRLDDPNQINSYNDIEERVIQPINSLLIVYQDSDYQDNYYTKKLNDLENEIEELSKEKEGYDKAELPTTTDVIVHIRPLVMTYNRYEMSHLNGWDGNKLYIDQNNDQYLLAPQVGAGHKDVSTNRFTGMLMGIKKFNSSSTREIGLFGYHEGIQTIKLDAETGNAIFGADNGNQIEITPTKAEIKISNTNGKIYSGDHDELDKLTNGFYLSSDGLSIGSNFKVTNDGTINATAGTFTGTLDGATLIAPQGYIGGFEIGDVYIRTSDSSVDIRSDLKQIVLQNDDGDKLAISRGNITLYNNSSRLGSFMNASHGDSYNGLGIACDGGRFLGLGYYTSSNSYHAVLRVNDSSWFTWNEKLICYDDLRMTTSEKIYFSPSSNNTSTNCYIGPMGSIEGLRINTATTVTIATPDNHSYNSNYLFYVNQNSSGNSAYFNGKVYCDGNLQVIGNVSSYNLNLTNNSENQMIQFPRAGSITDYYSTYQLLMSLNNQLVIYKSGESWSGETSNYLMVVGARDSENKKAAYFDGAVTCTDFYSLATKSSATTSQEPNGYVNASTGHLGRSTAGSSLRWKNNITKNIKEELNPNKLYNLSVKQFKYNTNYLTNSEDKRYNTELVGFIAEEVDNIYPTACDYDEYGLPSGWNNHYMIPPMLKLIQDQHKEIEQLNQDIVYLKGELDILKQQLEVKGC